MTVDERLLWENQFIFELVFFFNTLNKPQFYGIFIKEKKPSNHL